MASTSRGIAARGSRLLLGLRGPVLRGVAIVVELAAEPKTDEELALHPLGPDDRCYLSTSSTSAATACATSIGTATTS